jgi:hypothetical protein
MDTFVAKLTDAGATGTFVWAQSGGGTQNDRAEAIAVNGTSIYVTGAFESATTTYGSTILTNAGTGNTGDVFITKLTDAGSTGTFAWAQRAGGTEYDAAWALATNGSAVFVTGAFNGTAGFGGATLTSVGMGDIYVTKLTDAGSFLWAQIAGGAGHQAGCALALTNNKVYVGGGCQLPAAFGSQTIPGPVGGGYVGFLASLTDIPSGTTTGMPADHVQVFPNPAHATATVRILGPTGATHTALVLRDALGRTVGTHTLALPTTGLHHELDLSGLAPGVYALHVQAGAATAVRRLVVE